MREALVEQLVCPLSGQGLSLRVLEHDGDDVTYGTLSTDAATYPVVAGVPVLTGARHDETVALLLAGRRREAVAEAAFGHLSPNRISRLLSVVSAFGALAPIVRPLLARQRDRRRARGVAALLDRDPLAAARFAYVDCPARSLDAFDYFAFRYSMPRHLVGLACIEALLPADGPVLDLGCGAGHLTWAARGRSDRGQIVGVDRELFLLLAARALVPTADFVCADLTALPFRSAWAARAFAFDVLSFVRPKWPAVREIDRVLAPDGQLALTSVKNGLVDHVYAGEPLPPGGWRRLVAHLQHRLLPDQLILERYLAGSGLPAGQEPPAAALDACQTLTVVAAKGQAALADEPRFCDWPHARGPLGVNPLLRPAPAAPGELRYVLRFPSRTYADDNRDMTTYLPGEVRISEQVAHRAASGERPPELDAHIRSLAVLGLPARLVPDPWPRPSSQGGHRAS